MKRITTNLSLLIIICAAITAYGQEGPERTGSVLQKQGGIVTIVLDAGDPIATGAAVTIYKFFKKTIFGMETTGWLEAADAVVISSHDTRITARITKNKSEMVVNGKKVDHLTPGTRVKVRVAPGGAR